jgi:hypothetical protein
MKKIFFSLVFTILILIGFASLSEAQTITKTLAWEQPETQAIVSTFITTVKIDAAAAVQVTPTLTASTVVGNLTHAATPIILAAGTHTIVVTETNTSGLSGTSTLNYNPGVSPSNPVNITITVTVTVP